MSIEMVEENSFNEGTKIKVIGVGGGGGNAVEHMIRCGVQGVEFICANTDAQALGASSASLKIHLGSTGLGAGGKPAKGKEAAMSCEQEVRAALEGTDMLFVTAGMGGGTGTGAAPEIARIAKSMGILTVGVVTKPFQFEGSRRMSNADAGLAELEANVDSLIVVLNQKLLEVLGNDVMQDQAYAHCDDVLKNAVGGIAEIITVRGQVNVDFEDVRTVMEAPGRAMLGTATASGPTRAVDAANEAVKCPLLEGIHLSGAKGVLVLVSASKASLKLMETDAAMNAIGTYASPDAYVIFGTAYDESLGDAMRVTVVATGLSNASAKQSLRVVQPVQVQGLRTGTDDMVIPTLTQPLGHANPTGGTMMAPSALRPTHVGHGAGIGAVGGSSVPVIPQVWNTRTNAAERVNALSASGMDDTDIPAFLRKQAD